MRLTQREIATIRAALRLWRAHLKQVGNPSNVSDFFTRYLPLSPKEIDRLSDRIRNAREAPHVSRDWAPGCLSVPTFYGHRESRTSDDPDFAEPYVPVAVGEADGVRLMLGSDDSNDDEKPEIQIERRPHGWAIFLHPTAFDSVANIYFLDDGRSFLLPEWNEQPIETVSDIPEDLDAG
jgi:hypothetical protein